MGPTAFSARQKTACKLSLNPFLKARQHKETFKKEKVKLSERNHFDSGVESAQNSSSTAAIALHRAHASAALDAQAASVIDDAFSDPSERLFGRFFDVRQDDELW